MARVRSRKNKRFGWRRQAEKMKQASNSELPVVDWSEIQYIASNALQQYGTDVEYRPEGGAARTVRSVIYKQATPDGLAGDIDIAPALCIFDPSDFTDNPPVKLDQVVLTAGSYTRIFAIDSVELIMAENKPSLYRCILIGG